MNRTELNPPVWVPDLFSHLTTNNMMDKIDTERFTIIASKTCVLNTPNHGTVGTTYFSEDTVECDDTEKVSPLDSPVPPRLSR